MAELRLESLTKVFPGKNQVRAVQSLSLQVNSGECVALLGPSGAGKSTILRLIAGLEQATAGEVFIDGASVRNLTAAAREVSMAFQYPALLPQLTVEQNLELGPKLRGLKEIGARVSRIAELLGIGSLLARKPETLSGGEQQRVALGRALIAEPRILLLDEPLASLDPLARTELREVIRRVQRELGLTTLYVTHDQGEAAAVADRIALLREGALQQFATARELYLEPKSLFSARFFGADGLNLLKTTVSPRDSGWIAQVAKTFFPLARNPARTTGNLSVGFRPSSVRIVAADHGAWTLQEIRDLGWTNSLQLVCSEHRIFSVHAGEGQLFPVGARFNVEVEPDRTFLFDLETGERLA
jgi:multiple sugar transport system ATP-binding protein